MLLSRNEIKKIAAAILKKEGNVGPTVSIHGDMNRTVMGGKGGGASVSLRPAVNNPMGMQTGAKAPAAPATGGTNGTASSKS